MLEKDYTLVVNLYCIVFFVCGKRRKEEHKLRN